MAKVKEGGHVICETLTGRRTATVIYARQMRICDVRLTTLKRDAEYPGLKINSREDFVRLINSLRTGHMPMATLESEITVIMLEVKAPVDSMPPFALQT